ncbi:MAG: hypothetical protein FGM57_01900 [Candidatus Taylorbacteria bacterium]|nr:hypothetical protein [Candidatus Taylorbacteria bacterium]
MNDLTIYLTRSFSILGTSLWEYWYRSKQFQEISGFNFTQGVFFGTPAIGGYPHEYMVRCFRSESDLKRMKDSFHKIIETKPDLALRVLESAFNMYTAERSMQRKQPEDQKVLRKNLQFEYHSIEEVCDTFVSIAVYTAILPYFWFDETAPESRIQELCRKLRADTLYPSFFHKVLLPYLEGRTGIAREDLNLFTFNEIRALDQSGREVFEEAILKRRNSISGKDFMYLVIDGVASLEFVSREESVRRIGEYMGDVTELVGIPVSFGTREIVTGVARVLTGSDISNITFNDGDILVTMNSNPAYIPLISKAGAVLSEEGGSASHTSVIVQEGLVRNIPTVMGIKRLLDVVVDNSTVTVNMKNGSVILHP